MKNIPLASLALWFCLGVAHGASSSQLQPLVAGNSAFALDLYGRLQSGSANVFFSPHSISTCLAMAYAGARGETASQMASVLRFAGEPNQIHASFAELQRLLDEAGRQRGLQINVANALWAQQGHPFLPPFLNIARRGYHANVNLANFETGAESARNEINAWVAQTTHDRIKDILPAGSVDARTRLVLANAIYFKGAWAVPFHTNETHPLPFHLSKTTEVRMPLMHQVDRVRYMEDAALQAVDLPYSGKELAMLVLLPKRIDGCAELGARLTPQMLLSTLAQMQAQKVEIFLPRFKLDARYDLVAPLAGMGMSDAFGSKANFSGIDGTRELFISGVFHKAWVEVSEEGTEAAAATVTTFKATSVMRPPAPPPVFRADHPFIFLIRDVRSGSILFLGRLAQPST
jgi:serpin B